MIRHFFTQNKIRIIFIAALFFLLYFIGLADNSCNISGLILKILAFYFLYKAVVEIGLQKPRRLFLRGTKQREEELLKSDRFNKTMLNALPFYMDIIDENGNIIFLNKKMLAVFGESVIGKKCWEIYRDNKKMCGDCPLKKGIKIGHVSSIEAGGFYGGKIYKIIHTGINFQGKKALMKIIRDVTEEKTIEEVLQESKIYAESIVNTVRMPLIVLDFDLKVISANWFFYRSCGFLEEKTIGRFFYEIYGHHWDIGDLRKKLEDLIKRNFSFYDLEISHNFPAIGRRTMLFTARRIYQVGHKKQMILLSIMDITERKNAEDRIRASEEKYRNIFDGANDAIISIDRNDAVTSWNKSAERIFGWSANEAMGKKLASLIVPPNFLKERNARVEFGLKGNSLAGLETVRMRKNGEKINVSLSFFPIITAKNEIAGLSGIIRDITQRKSNEEKLKRRACELKKLTKELKKFQNAVNNAFDIIFITDPKGVILYINKAAEKFTGYSEKEIIGKKAEVLWGNMTDSRFYYDFWRTIKDEKKSFVGDIVNQRKNGEKYYAEMRISPVFDNENKVIFYVGIERDVSGEKEINRAKTEFVSIASHELRTPLSNMSLSVEMLLDNIAGNLNKDQKEYLTGLHGDIKEMTELVDALLNTSRIELGTLIVDSELTDILEVNEAVLKSLASQIKKKDLEIKKEGASSLPLVNIDRNLTRIILRNIYTNSIKYTPPKGKIICRISADEKKILLKISDNGCGIPKDQQDKIFSKLFRARNAVRTSNKGVGLGLYIVKSMADRCGLDVWFESEENQGTAFYVSIPLSGMRGKK